MSTYSPKIWNYKFSDAKSRLWTLPTMHFFFALVFWMSQEVIVGMDLRTFINVIVIIISSILIWKLDWRIQRNTYLTLGLYWLIFIIEIISLGMPVAPLDFDERIGKGFITTFILYLAPWIYILLRFIGIFAFINLAAVLNRKPI